MAHPDTALYDEPVYRDTVAYYDQRASGFARDTADLNLQSLYERFLAHVPKGGTVLDAGCGPGRDVAAFSHLGYAVSAFDASAEMVRLAQTRTGLPVIRGSFVDIDDEAEYDGVWACASLLHVPEQELPGVLEKLACALKPAGVLYASFKLGQGERWETFPDGSRRYFHDLTEPKARLLFAPANGFKLVDLWITQDVRPGRAHKEWVNVLARRAET